MAQFASTDMTSATQAHKPALRDVIVIGGSAGGLESLRAVLRGLRQDLPAALFVVLHMGDVSHLAQALEVDSPVPVLNAESGQSIKSGRLYVAIPGHHLLIHEDHLLLRRGPRENFARPAIDPLFRSAAASFGSRVTAVLLSGGLSDGTAGLQAVKRCGGVIIVQNPTGAAVPDMLQNALRYVDVDHVCEPSELADLLNRLSGTPAGPMPEIPLDIRLETAIAAQELADMSAENLLGTPSRFTCPECHGALWEIPDGSLLRFRCLVGHAFTAENLQKSQGDEAERLLEMLVRSHQERAALTERMADRALAESRSGLAKQLRGRLQDYRNDVEILKQVQQRIGTASGLAPARVTEDDTASAKPSEKNQ